jgi:uncharacterized membrane protein
VNLLATRHRGFYAAAAAGLVVGLAILPFAREIALAVAVDVFFLGYLLVVVPLASTRLTSGFLRAHADEEDPPAVLIFVVMLAAVLVSAISLFSVLMGGHGVVVLQLALSAASVVLGWLAVHTMMAMHYAWEYYGSPDEGVAPLRKDGAAGGLEFPGSDAPDGTAFLYFAYVIGMTAQTSDTAVSSNAMRRIVTLHGIFAFFFNTIIVAAAVNIVVTLGH